jgi:glyoxylase-like metal-dependent hydrolase (beta-lactamase superfamily II)
MLHEQLGAPIWAAPQMMADVAATLGVESRVEGRTVPIGGDVLHVIYTPGHAFDHVSFWLPRARILFAGDVILGRGSTLVTPPEGDMASYMRTLDEMKQLNPRIIAPGHGPLILDPAAKIDEYAAHRRQREQQVLAALAEKPDSAEGLVARIYVDVSPELHELARGSVTAQLKKLEDEGRVEVIGGSSTSTWRVADSARRQT